MSKQIHSFFGSCSKFSWNKHKPKKLYNGWSAVQSWETCEYLFGYTKKKEKEEKEERRRKKELEKKNIVEDIEAPTCGGHPLQTQCHPAGTLIKVVGAWKGRNKLFFPKTTKTSKDHIDKWVNEGQVPNAESDHAAYMCFHSAWVVRLRMNRHA